MKSRDFPKIIFKHKLISILLSIAFLACMTIGYIAGHAAARDSGSDKTAVVIPTVTAASNTDTAALSSEIVTTDTTSPNVNISEEITSSKASETTHSVTSQRPPVQGADVIPKKGEYLPASYFDHTVLVGDSVAKGLKNQISYLNKQGKDYFGECEYLTEISFGIYNAIKGNKLPIYQGEPRFVEDSIAMMGDRDTVYISLGLNDAENFRINSNIENYKKLINNILAKNHDIKIVVMSITPVTRQEEAKDGNNLSREAVNALNDGLLNICEENGYTYLDAASVLTDSEGYLPDEYSYDGSCHMNEKGLNIWIEYIRTHKPID